MKKIIFLLPGQGTKPSGGFKIVYQYADNLASMGYSIQIAHIAWKYNTTNIIKGLIKYLYFFSRFKPDSWFVFKNKVDLCWHFFPININADYVVATSWETAEILNKILKPKQMPVYFIQGDESEFDEVKKKHWEKRVISTWKYNWKKIVVSNFLAQKIKNNGNIITILNGLDIDQYNIIRPIDKRNPLSFSLIAHIFPLKGTMDAIRALEIVRGEFENIHVVVFSIYPKMEYIPDWMDYKFNPTQKEIVEIYNNSSIFISSSHTEGFGLPVAEAMACGCCTVVTDIPAYRDFTIENITSLYFPVGDYLMMARKIINLLEHDLSRQNMGKRGADFIREKLSLNKSIELFSSIFEDERQ